MRMINPWRMREVGRPVPDVMHIGENGTHNHLPHAKAFSNKDIWTAPLGEILTCQNDFGNPTYPYAVAMMTASNITIGHVCT